MTNLGQQTALVRECTAVCLNKKLVVLQINSLISNE
jgi:hypothetical protein